MKEATALREPFASWFVDVAADEVTVCPEQVDTEARENMWSFSLNRDMAANASPSNVEAFALAVSKARESWLAEHGMKAMCVYWWHDVQTGRLCFSMTSGSDPSLCFGAPVIFVESFVKLAEEWLSSPYLEGIPWEEFSPAQEDSREHLTLPVSVWARTASGAE